MFWIFARSPLNSTRYLVASLHRLAKLSKPIIYNVMYVCCFARKYMPNQLEIDDRDYFLTDANINGQHGLRNLTALF